MTPTDLFPGQVEFHAYLAAIVESSDDAILSKTSTGIITSWNPGAERLYGYTAEEAIGRHVSILVPDDQPDEIPAIMERLRRGERVDHYETVRQAKDGRRLNISLTVSPIRDTEGRMVGASAVAREITEHRRTEQQLAQLKVEAQQQKRLYETIIASTPDLVYVFDLDYRFTYANAALLAMWGRDWHDAIGKSLLEIGYEPWHAEMHEREIDQVVATKQPVRGEVPFPHHRLGRRIYDYIFVPILGPDGEVEAIAGTTRDVTEYRQTEQEFERKASQQATVAEFGQKALAGPALQELFDEAVRIIADAPDNELCKVLRLLPGGEQAQLEAGVGWQEGLVGQARVPTGRESQAGYTLMVDEPVVVKDLREETRFTGPPLLHDHGVVSGMSVIIRSEGGKPWGVLSTHTRQRRDYAQDDVNFLQAMANILANAIQRHWAEQRLRSLNETLEQRVSERTAEAEKRAEQLQLMAKQLTEAEQRERRRLARLLHDDLQQILVAAKLRLMALRPADAQLTDDIEQLLAQAIDTSRSLSTELAPSVLYDVGLYAALEWLGRWAKDKYALDVEVEADDSLVVGDVPLRVMLFEAVRELLLNVVKHANVNEARLRLQYSDGRVAVVVEDFGDGFDPEDAHAAANGSGYGLFSLRERLELVGGGVQIDSAPGKGTRVTITTPLASDQREVSEEPATPAHTAESAEPLPTKDKEATRTRVLLTDDHEIVRQGLANLLNQQSDMEMVAEAASGEEAVDLAREHRPDVVVMDISLPGMSGIEATRRITDAFPQICVIGLSVHEERDVAEQMRSAGAVGFYNKSQAAEQLVQAIRDCMQYPPEDSQLQSPGRS